MSDPAHQGSSSDSLENSEHDYECPACGLHFGETRSLRQHKVEEHNWSQTKLEPFQCHVCKKRFSSVETLKLHDERKHKSTVSRNPEQDPTSDPEEAAACIQIEDEEYEEGAVFQDPEQRTTEEPAHHHHQKDPETYIFQCKKCEGFFNSENALNRHIFNFHPRVGYQCPYCDAIWKAEKCFKDHMLIHKKFPCDMCHERFDDEKSWKSHSFSHGFQCPCCRKKFAAQSGLYWHILREHQDAETFWECPLCIDEVHFKNLAAFKNHCENFHPDTYPHMCEICDKVFRTSRELMKHKTKHSSSGEKRKRSEESDDDDDGNNGGGNKNPRRESEDKSVCSAVPSHSSSSTPLLKCQTTSFQTSGKKSSKKLQERECYYCGESFLGPISSHRCPDGRRMFKCVDCPLEFSSVDKLNEHTLEIHFHCYLCKFYFSNKNLANMHKFQRHTGKILRSALTKTYFR